MTVNDRPLEEHLRGFEPLLERTWRGNLIVATTEEPQIDVTRWERALNGRAIRCIHSLNDGEYGGETITFWDSDRQTLRYFYFTTGGFHTEGEMRVEGRRFIGHEVVTGNKQGITEVESVAELMPDGRLRTSARYLQQGHWVAGHSAVYVEDPNARIIFR